MTLRRPFRLWALLLVLLIACQALAPVGEGLRLRSGAAFSADTVEVAVAPVRRVVEAAVPALPAPPVPLAVVLLPLVAAVLSPWRPKPRQTAPPRRNPALSQRLSPRAPPLT